MSVLASKDIVTVARGSEGERTITVHLDECDGKDWYIRVHQPLLSVIREINRHCTETPHSPIQVLCKIASVDDPRGFIAALLEGVRGAVGTAALELGSSGGRANTIIAGVQTQPSDVTAVISYLVDENRGGFTTGATIDLRKEAGRVQSRTGTVLVTGAAGGLGHAAASVIATSGRPLVLTDRDEAALSEASESIGAPAIACNLTDPEDLARLSSAAELADMDALVVEHGVGASSRFGSDYNFSDTARSLSVNAWSVHNVVEQFVPAITSKGGAIVVLSSQAGLYAEEGNSGYCSAKFAVNGYVSSLIPRLADSGATVQGLCPGPVDTPLMRQTLSGQARGLGVDPGQFILDRLKSIPLGRGGKPEQIGHSTDLLLNLHATGVILAPTGGEVLS